MRVLDFDELRGELVEIDESLMRRENHRAMARELLRASAQAELPRMSEIRETFVEAERQGPGRPPVADSDAKTDALTLKVELRADEVNGWGASLMAYLDRWPEELAPVTSGPGSAGQAPPEPAAARSADIVPNPPGGVPAPSRDRGN